METRHWWEAGGPGLERGHRPGPLRRPKKEEAGIRVWQTLSPGDKCAAAQAFGSVTRPPPRRGSGITPHSPPSLLLSPGVKSGLGGRGVPSLGHRLGGLPGSGPEEERPLLLTSMAKGEVAKTVRGWNCRRQERKLGPRQSKMGTPTVLLISVPGSPTFI